MLLRAEITKEVIENCFRHLEENMKDVDPSTLFNYDEINLTDDPASKTVLHQMNRGNRSASRNDKLDLEV